VHTITKRDHLDGELAFIFVLLAATTTMGGAVADADNGMMGSELSPLMQKLYDSWLECGKNKVGHISAAVTMLVQQSTPTAFGALTMCPGIDKATIRVLYKDSTMVDLKAFPAFLGACEPTVHCKHCKVAFSGLDQLTSLSIRGYQATLIHVQKHVITRVCPKDTSAVCCESLVTGELYTGYEVRPQ